MSIQSNAQSNGTPKPIETGDSKQYARHNLLGMNRQSLVTFFQSLGEKRFRAEQILKWVHQRGVVDLEAMTDLSKSLRVRLAELTELRMPETVSEQVSSDGTRKWLFRLDNGNSIETVFIPEDDRGTLCVSSQVGCALNCSFCATARQGFNRNLSTAEIIAQIWLARRALERSRKNLDEPRGVHGGRDERIISNIVLMGMGEPLLNFDNVAPALELMLDDCAYGLSRRRVTLSTAGMAPMLDALARRVPVALAVSLHASNDALRNELVPINRSFPIEQLLQACRRYAAFDPKQTITFEYVMLDGVNDQIHHARELVRLLRSLPAKVNLIPFNPFTGSGYKRSSPERIDAFRQVLVGAGIMTITRKTRGEDIDAACGQLAGKVQPRSARIARQRGLSQADIRLDVSPGLAR